MPKSKNKRKSGSGKKGSSWSKHIAKDNQKRQAKKDAVYEKLKQQMLG